MGFAILWIMFFHYPANTGISVLDVIQYYGYGGVDIFLFFSGFGLYFSLSKGSVDLRQFYKKRFMRILPVFWLYLLVTFVIAMDFSPKSFWELICCCTTLGYWIPVIPYKLWYISCILLFYAVFPFFYKSFKKHGIIVAYIAIAIGLLLTLLYAVIMVFAYDNRNEGGVLILTISRIPIFFIGSVFGHWAKDGCTIQVTRRVKVLSLLALALGAAVLSISTVFLSDYLWICSLYFLPFILITPPLCVLLAILFEKLPGVINRLFVSLGDISLELFMAHVYLYGLLVKQLEPIVGPGLTAVIVVCLSFVFAFFLYNFNKTILQKHLAKLLK